ncbi:hypothetical protein BDY19DRAFT_987551 [Irpex rosettiformis]|uniref:Uncharacterized protein n=1 Tax=Irpex rosettiformis TaxID=378272 RepID=A0ACB8TR19_9APHY|nr:hypothetical protein BDY19DRAFT_987551 [Irpex rosettiformis]
MHLIWENVVKNLMLLWSGDYKGLSSGKESYEFSSSLWEAIGLASADSGSTIPSCFGPRSPNVASEKVSWTADSRSFWTLFVAPIVLKGRFMHDKYYAHFVDFVQLINKCLQYELRRSEVAEIKAGFVCWVKKYEEFYYQYDPSRLSACPLTIHALLHIADSIVLAGPVWTSWAFPMERYCAFIQPAFKSRRFPFASVNRFILDHARLSHIQVLYDAAAVLRLRGEELDGYYGGYCLREYDHCAFLPSSRLRTFEQGITSKIIGALCTRFTTTPAVMRRVLHGEFREWARIRILPNGDTIRAAAYGSTSGAIAQGYGNTSRDATFIRYQLLVDKNARARHRDPSFTLQTFYGQLMHVVAAEIDAIPGRNIPPSRIVFGIIRSCKIEEHHPKLDVHYYSEEGPVDVIDISTVQCLVGRVFDRGRWGIFDRSGLLSRAIYTEDE